MVAATDWPALNQPGTSKTQLGSHPSISFSYLKLKLVEQPLTYFIASWPNSLFLSLCNMAGLVGYASSDEDDDTSPHAPSPKVYFMSNLVQPQNLIQNQISSPPDGAETKKTTSEHLKEGIYSSIH